MSRKIETWDEYLHAMSIISALMDDETLEGIRKEEYNALVDSVIEYEREILTNKEEDVK